MFKAPIWVRAVAACAVAGAAVAGSAVLAQADTKEAPLLAAQGQRIPGKYIVVLDGGGSGASVARHLGVRADRVYTSALDGFAAALTKGQLARVRRDPAVKYVTPDGVARVSALAAKPAPQAPTDRPSASGKRPVAPPSTQVIQPSATWGIDRLDQRNRPVNGQYLWTGNGSGVTAYVIDTGIRYDHADFGGRAVPGFTAVGDGRGANDCHGHGTHVAGTIGGATYGVAKGVRLVGVRVLDCSGSGAFSGVIAGIDYVTYTHSGPAVANMSLGGGYSPAINDATAASIASGVTYAVAAGNSNDNACNYSPSSTPTAITVAASDINDVRAGFSNWGACTDVFAPGVSIWSDWWTSTTATANLSGTSMASPHVAGLAALYLQASPYAAPATVTAALKTSATPGLVTNPAGSPNLLARKLAGNITANGASQYQPDGGYWLQGAGYVRGWLQGSAGTDFDLYLYRWNGSAWVAVAADTSTSNNGRVVYNGSAAYYRWQVLRYGGTGGSTYDLHHAHP